MTAIKYGVLIADTARRLNFNLNIIQTTIRRDSIRQSYKSLPRVGRSSKVSKRDVQKIVHYARINPKYTYTQVRKNMVSFLFSRTINRILKPFHINK
jgi:uncharacterized protein (UPF0128 family)